MSNHLQQERGWGLGISIIAALVILMLVPASASLKLGQSSEGSVTILTGIYLQFWGILFLLSYHFSHKTFFLRGLLWLCENTSHPRGRKMAFFYFALMFGLGTTALFHGIGSLSAGQGQARQQSSLGQPSIEGWWYKDPIFYIVVAIIIAGIYYRYRTHRNKTDR